MIDVEAELADVRRELAPWEQAITFVKEALASGRFTEGAARAQIEHFRRCAEKVRQGSIKGPRTAPEPRLGPLTDGTTPTPLLPDDPGWIDIEPGVRQSTNVGLSSLVERCRKNALLKLAERGVTVPDGVEPYQAVADAGFNRPSPEWQLGEIENLARLALGVAAKGDVDSALGLAVKLGICVRDFELHEYDKPLATGIKQTDGLNQVRDAGNKKKTRDAETWKQKARDAASAIWARHPEWSDLAVAKHVIKGGHARIQKKDTGLQDATVETVRKAIRQQKVGITA